MTARTRGRTGVEVPAFETESVLDHRGTVALLPLAVESCCHRHTDRPTQTIVGFLKLLRATILERKSEEQ